MKLSEELIYRGMKAETTFATDEALDSLTNQRFYLGADPSADSLTIGNLAALMMARVFVRHGWQPYLLVGGATGQIGDPKENEERGLKPLEEIAHNKSRITEQFRTVVKSDQLKLVDNNDWFKDIKYVDFLREIGKHFSMTQLLDRQFVQSRIGEGGVGISYAEFSYTLIQGYDFLHLFRTENIILQLCGADQFGNCISGMQLIRKIDGKEAHVYSCPLVIDPVSGRKFGKSEGNAIWLASDKTSPFDFYQFWLNQSDESLETLLKIYTDFTREQIEELLTTHAANPSLRTAQKALAFDVTRIVHGETTAETVQNIANVLFGGAKLTDLSESELATLAETIPSTGLGQTVVDVLVATGLAASKSEARTLISGGAISLGGDKIQADQTITNPTILKKGKNKFALVN